MGLGTTRTLTDEIRMSYGYLDQIRSGSYLILGMSLRTMVCHYGCHKDIRDVTDDLAFKKDDP